MTIRYKLKSPVSQDSNVDLDDVWMIKRALADAGHYDVPKDGLSPFPDAGLFRGIEKFQRLAGLKVDGIMKPGGETEQRMDELFVRSPIYRCKSCGGPHGGVYSPSICATCLKRGTL